MCGIAGIVASRLTASALAEPLKRMSDSIIHRGPDGSGQWIEHGVGIAHRRLSIIDHEGGGQPFVCPNRRFVLTFNGEIYNYKKLRTELKAKGMSFRTSSDTEVLMNAWIVWGEKALEKIEGMFAFGIWDTKSKQLFLARDRTGIKPLYVGKGKDESVVFGSELKALLASSLITDRKLRADAVVDYLTLGYTPLDKCILDRVFKVLPGELVTVCGRTSRIRSRFYWRLEPPCNRETNRDVTAEETWSTIKNAVECQLVADVPVASFLSGGVDSSAITSAMAQVSSDDVFAYTMAIQGGAYDESEYAKLVADHCGVNQKSRAVTIDDCNSIDTIIDTYDEPFADSSSIPTLALCHFAGAGHKVALSGDGGDECFLGYPWYETHSRRASYSRTFGQRNIRAISGGMLDVYRRFGRGRVSLPGQGTLQSMTGDSAYSYMLSQKLDPSVDVLQLLNPQFRIQVDDYQTSDIYRKIMARAGSEDAYLTAQFVDFHLYLPGDILTKVDRASMAASLEVRVPMLDERILELIQKSTSKNIRLGRKRKGILNAAVRGHVPNIVIDRRKQGFSVPISDWFGHDLGSALDRELDDRSSSVFDVLSPGFIQKLLDDHRVGRSDYGNQLWSALVLIKSLRKLGAT